jgi:signal transduction histidine kinase
MRERAELIGGTLAIRSSPGEGTSVRLTVPLSGAKRALH